MNTTTTTNKKPPAVFCARASSPKQEDSVQSQLDNDLPYFQERYNIVEVYVEGTVSASKDRSKRVEFNRMIEDLTTGKYKNGVDGQRLTICCRDSSRFCREDVYDSGDFKAKLKRAGIKLDGRQGGIVDYGTRNGQMMDTFKTFNDSQLPLTVAENGLNGRVRALEKGKTTGKPIPYGFHKRFITDRGLEIIVQRGEKGKRMKDWDSKFIKGKASEVEAMEYLFTLALTQDLSYRAMARIMQEKFGERWTWELVNDRLHNPCYAGGDWMGIRKQGTHFQLNGRQAVEKHLNIHPSSAHIVWGFHDAIVSREQWEAVQVKYPVNHTERKGKKAYACSTLVKCGVCGKTMTAKTDQHGKVRYRCQSFSDATSPLCGGWTIREDELLDELLPRLTATLDAKTIEGLSVNPPTIAQPHEVEGLKAEVEKMKKDMGDRLARLHLIDLDFLPSYQTGIKEARQRLDAMMKQIAEMETPDLGEWKERLAKFWDETKTILVKTGEQMKVRNEWLGEAVIEPEAPIEPSTLRNALKGLKTTITLFFSRSQDGKRWNRTRTIVEGELGCPFDASSTDPGHG